MNDTNSLPSWPKSFLLALLWLVAGSAVWGAVFAVIGFVVENYTDNLHSARLFDQLGALLVIVSAPAIGIAALVGSVKVHRTSRVAVWLAVLLLLLLLGGGIYALCLRIVGMMIWRD